MIKSIFRCCSSSPTEENAYELMEERIDKIFSGLLTKSDFYSLQGDIIDNSERAAQFLVLVNKRRTKGYEITYQAYRQITSLIKIIIIDYSRFNVGFNEKYSILSHCIIVSQTFYCIQQGFKIYIQDEIENMPVFIDSDFWINECKYHIDTNKDKMKKKELTHNAVNTIHVAKIMSLVHNMVIFHIDEKVKLYVIDTVCKEYNVSKDYIMTLKTTEENGLKEKEDKENEMRDKIKSEKENQLKEGNKENQENEINTNTEIKNDEDKINEEKNVQENQDNEINTNIEVNKGEVKVNEEKNEPENQNNEVKNDEDKNDENKNVPDNQENEINKDEVKVNEEKNVPEIPENQDNEVNTNTENKNEEVKVSEENKEPEHKESEEEIKKDEVKDNEENKEPPKENEVNVNVNNEFEKGEVKDTDEEKKEPDVKEGENNEKNDNENNIENNNKANEENLESSNAGEKRKRGKKVLNIKKVSKKTINIKDKKEDKIIEEKQKEAEE